MIIFKQMAAILGDIDAITKERTNTSGGSFKYRGIDDIYNELHSSFAKYGVFCTTEILDRAQIERQSKSGGALFYTVCKIKFTFWAEDGSSVSSLVMGEAMDSGDKGTNKAMAIAHKYALLQAFLVPTEDEKDPDGKSHDVAPKSMDTRGNYIPPVHKPSNAPVETRDKPKAEDVLKEGYPTRDQLSQLMNDAVKKGWEQNQVITVMQRTFPDIKSASELTLKRYWILHRAVTERTFSEAMELLSTRKEEK